MSIKRFPATSAELSHPGAPCGFSQPTLRPGATLRGGPHRGNPVRPFGSRCWEGKALTKDENRICEKTNIKHCVNASEEISNSSSIIPEDITAEETFCGVFCGVGGCPKNPEARRVAGERKSSPETGALERGWERSWEQGVFGGQARMDPKKP